MRTFWVRRPARWVAVATTSISLLWVGELRAQIQLPDIVVVTPSPVVKPGPKPQPTPPGEAAPPPPPAGLIIEDAFVPLTIVPLEQIVGTPGATLTDALQTKPGIIGSTFAPGANRPVIRGFDNFRVLVQEGGIGSHDVSALSEDHAVPIDPGIIDRIEVVRRLQGERRLRHRRGLRRRLQAARRRLRHAARPAVQHLRRQRGLCRRHLLCRQERLHRHRLLALRKPLRYPGRRCAGRGHAHRPEAGQIQSRGEWRVGAHGVEAIRFWLGSSWYAHDEIGFAAGPPEVGSRFINRQTEGRVEVQHLPVMTGLGELRGAVGVHFGQKKITALTFRRRRSARPRPHRQRGSVRVRGAAAHQAAAACRRRPVSNRPRSTASASTS